MKYQQENDKLKSQVHFFANKYNTIRLLTEKLFRSNKALQEEVESLKEKNLFLANHNQQLIKENEFLEHNLEISLEENKLLNEENSCLGLQPLNFNA